MADSYASSGTNFTGDFQSTGAYTDNNQGNAAAQHQGYATTPASTAYGVYDPSTGYYYDASTGLYYDPNSGGRTYYEWRKVQNESKFQDQAELEASVAGLQYYYNGTTGQFLYWNGSKYQAVSQDGTPVVNQQANQNAAAQQDEKKTEVEKDKISISGQKPKNARKIAKDMERWAKKMNTATEAKKHAVKQAQDELKALEQKEEELRKRILTEKTVTGILGKVADAKDGVRSLFVPDNDEEGSVLKLGSALSAGTASKPGAARLVDIPDDDDDDYVDETKFVDTSKLACLLCKRQFPSKDVLTKHLQISQLHKQNLEKYKQAKEK